MQDIADIIKGMPQLGTTIQMDGKEVKVIGCKISESAAYVGYDDGGAFEQWVHVDNLKRLQCARED